MPSNYTEIIQFNNQVGGVKVRQKGIKISDDLCVAYASPYSAEERYRIFSIVSGRPVVKLEFNNVDQAKAFAKWLDETYKDFWFLLSDYPRMDIPNITMWTIPNGIRIWLALNTLETRKSVLLTTDTTDDTITLDDLKRAYQASKDKVADYMKFPQQKG